MAVLNGPALAAATAEVKAYLRAAGTQEDELIGRMAASAAGLCEGFTGRWLLVRPGVERVAPGSSWQRLRAAPIRAIAGVDALPTGGSAVPLPVGDYSIDIDANDCGWVRVIGPTDVRRVQVRFEAGLAESWAALPESLRQGVVRLAAHLYTHRSAESGGEPPLAVTAMWRPWRRIAIGAPAHV
jgi:uncharacterized phiE125 gp8 family phage protein